MGVLSLGFDMETEILASCIAAVTILVTVFLIRRLCDLVILILFAIAVFSPFILKDIVGEDAILATAIGLGILMPILTMPLWSISKLLRGNEDVKQNAQIKKLEERTSFLEQRVGD